jgi:hypothetical protein
MLTICVPCLATSSPPAPLRAATWSASSAWARPPRPPHSSQSTAARSEHSPQRWQCQRRALRKASKACAAARPSLVPSEATRQATRTHAACTAQGGVCARLTTGLPGGGLSVCDVRRAPVPGIHMPAAVPCVGVRHRQPGGRGVKRPAVFFAAGGGGGTTLHTTQGLTKPYTTQSGRACLANMQPFFDELRTGSA